MKNDKRTNNDLQNITYKTKDNLSSVVITGVNNTHYINVRKRINIIK